MSQCSLRLNDIITFGGHKKPQVNDRLPCSKSENYLYSIKFECDVNIAVPQLFHIK